MGNARKTTVKLLSRMETGSSFSNILLDGELKRADLSAQEKKFASALFYGTLERRLTLDGIISRNLSKPGSRLDPQIRNILRIGIYQLLYMDHVPDPAAVDECVKLARSVKPQAAGFVNAVLRSFIRSGKALPEGRTQAEKLMLKYSCPQWLCEKWLAEYGEDTALAMLETSLGQPPVTVRVNTLKVSAEEAVKALEKDGFSAEVSEFDKNCLEIKGSGAIEQSDSYKQGLFHVQDLSCQLCCAALAPKGGETVLDICSAPGGKAFTIAEMMNNNGRVLAFDLHENRVKLIRSGAERLGLDIISAEKGDGRKYRPDMPMADKILCDVPCSGLGVIRRKPEIKYKPPEDFHRLPEIQYEILEASSRYVKKGGLLVYSTCTLSRAENDEVADRFLKEHPDFSGASLPDIFGAEASRITITPDKFGSDGFFIAVFNKRF